MQKWLIFSGHSPEYDALGVLTVPNHAAYARARGYDVFVHHHERGDVRADAWDKARWRRFLQLLPLYDGIMTVGADALFMRYDIAIESVFGEGAEQQMAEERIGGCTLNNDVALWRNAPSSYEMVNWFLDEYDEHLKRPLGYQASLSEQMWATPDKRLACVRGLRLVEPHVMNTCPQAGTGSTYAPGDWIIHFFGAPLEYKIEYAKRYLQEVKIDA